MVMKKSKAQGAVEFALILPILVIILTGILEMGHLVFVYVSVFNASREAARYGAATGTVGSIKQYQDCTNIRNAALRLRFLANFTAATISVKYDNGPGTTQSVECQNMNSTTWGTVGSGSRIVVAITSTYRPLFRLVPTPTFNINSMAARTIIGTVNLPVSP
jgi:Flp pilus assembly protein TadG